MQEKLDNGSKIEDLVSDYEDRVISFGSNFQRVALYLPSGEPNNPSLTEQELLEYLINLDNFSIIEGHTFYNQLEKNTIFTVIPDVNPFSNDTVYFDFLTTYYSPEDTVAAAALQIYDKVPCLLDHDINVRSMPLSKTSSVIQPWAICSQTSSSGTWTQDLTAYYYTKLVASMNVNFAGNKVVELLTDFLIDLLLGYYEEPISVIIDQIKDMTYHQFLEYIRPVMSPTAMQQLEKYDDWGALIKKFENWSSQASAISRCGMLDAVYLKYLCHDNLPPSDWSVFCTNYNEACAPIQDLAGYQLFFFFTYDQRINHCSNCGLTGSLPKNTSEDTDGDGYVDGEDNCPCIENSSQADIDLDGIGDACDDSDGDGVVDAIDNCRLTFNPDQTDINDNGIGDACDADFYNYNPDDCAQDTDGDRIVNCIDNCPTQSNPDQLDTDNDGVGDVCDNCPELFNISQDFAPCDIGEPEADSNCDQSDIDEEREQYDDYISDIFSCINNFGEGYDSRHVESELEGDAYSDPERVCVHSTIENRLGQDVLCAWWQNNPAWQLIGNTGVPVWGDYEANCGDAGGVEMTSEIRSIINEIVICCKSEADIGGLIERRDQFARMLACIPEDEPSFQCLNIKPQLGSLRDYFQLELDRANNAIQATQNHINQYCP